MTHCIPSPAEAPADGSPRHPPPCTPSAAYVRAPLAAAAVTVVCAALTEKATQAQHPSFHSMAGTGKTVLAPALGGRGGVGVWKEMCVFFYVPGDRLSGVAPVQWFRYFV